jgi:hypothetical protein
MTRTRIGGWAALVAMVWSALLATAFYVYVHGSTGADRNGSFLGFEGVAVGRAGVLTGAAMVLLVWGLYPHVRSRAGTRRGAVTAGVGAAAFLVGRLLQTWLANAQDPQDFEGIRVTLGFYLESLGSLLFGVGFVVMAFAGAGVVVARMRLAFLLTGVGTFLPMFSLVLIPDHEGAVLGWDLTATLLALPQWVGLALIAAGMLGTTRTVATASVDAAA